MKRLWIFVTFLAVYGNLAFAYNSDEQDSWYYDWYDGDDYESPDYAAEETKDNDFKFRTTSSDKQYDMRDYPAEDNRSEIKDDDNLDNAKNNTRKENQIEYLTSKEVENLGTDLTSQRKSASDVKVLNSPVGVGGDDSIKQIFEDTKAILNEETENDFSQDFVATEKAIAPTELIEETRRLLNDTSDAMEVENNKKDDEFLFQSDNNIHNNKKEYTDAGIVNDESEAVENLKTDLKRLQETWSKLNEFDENILELDDISNPTSSEKSKVDDSKNDDGNNKEQQTERIDEVSSEGSQVNKETNSSPSFLYLDDALLATESETSASFYKADNISSEEEIKIMNDEMESGNRKIIMTELGMSSNEVKNKENDVRDISSENRTYEITKNDIRNAQKVSLTVDSPTVITSPGFPRPYPTNTTIDWMISGDGMGIELNITDFSINGHVGDYLLIKPGGVDASGSSGLLFSYTLRNERRYRFLDVDKMFVRFEARPGPQVLPGFSFSVRMVAPRPGAPEPEPEPEVVIPEPPETITLNLGGLTLEGFLHIEEQFRQIVAGMAATYVRDNSIDPGVNTTLELTQIRSRAMCFHNWPKFEKCVEVTFGVPLVYEDDDEEREPRLNAADLTTMWETYSQNDPYAERLSSLGITEYEVPNDKGILTVWLVIAGGVVISMTMLAFALWRFSCFENYTRMPAFSDTDSVKEKRHLDLYPTPHQTLPPLYAGTDHKWADATYDGSTKGGYSNKSYMREDPYDFDSDEDIVPVSARNTSSFSPRDIYSV